MPHSPEQNPSGKETEGLSTYCQERKPPRRPAQAARLLQHSLGLIIASLEEGEESAHVERRCSKAVRAG